MPMSQLAVTLYGVLLTIVVLGVAALTIWQTASFNQRVDQELRHREVVRDQQLCALVSSVIPPRFVAKDPALDKVVHQLNCRSLL